jgi:Fur family ferric uptake transcriptional regulator
MVILDHYGEIRIRRQCGYWEQYQYEQESLHGELSIIGYANDNHSHLHLQRLCGMMFVTTVKLPMNQPIHLKSAGLKSTLPRVKVLSLFENSAERHLSAEEVYRLLHTSGDDVGLATVYRVLTQFVQAGLLIRHNFEGGKSVFELNQKDHHDHIVCLQCGHVEEFYDATIESRQRKAAAERGFALREHSLYIYGDCSKLRCPNKPKK